MIKEAFKPIQFTETERNMLYNYIAQTVDRLEDEILQNAKKFINDPSCGDRPFSEIFADWETVADAQVQVHVPKELQPPKQGPHGQEMQRRRYFTTEFRDVEFKAKFRAGEQEQNMRSNRKYMRYINGGSTQTYNNGSAVITTFINSSLSLNNILLNRRNIEIGMMLVLSHELSHFKDVITAKEGEAQRAARESADKSPTHTLSDPVITKNYINSPSEFKARLKEIITNLAETDMSAMERKWRLARSHEERMKILGDALSATESWHENSDMLTPEHKLDVYKSVYHYLENAFKIRRPVN